MLAYVLETPRHIFSLNLSEADERSRLYRSIIQSLKNESSVSSATKVRSFICVPSFQSIQRNVSALRQRTCVNFRTCALRVNPFITIQWSPPDMCPPAFTPYRPLRQCTRRPKND